jgi:hypothetical protein
MATVNPYFQSGGTIGRSSEQTLYEDLMIESMKIYGFEVYYLPRKSNSLDSILSEDYLNTFDYAYPIEMYLENTMGFEGDGELMSKFGLEIRDTGTFIVSRKRWTDVIGSQNVTILPRPAEGDIIFFPKSKSFFEIRKVEGQEPFYQVGKLYVYKMMCELYQFANERFNTGVDEIDSITAEATLDIDAYQLLQETGEALLFETNALTPIVLENYNLNLDGHALIGANNEEFEKEVNDVLDFSERNPFGEVFQ